MENKFFGMKLYPGGGNSGHVTICGKRFRLRCFPKLFSEYLEVVGDDHNKLEGQGRKLKGRMRSGDVERFVTDVCWWGGATGKRNLGRILTKNKHSKIARVLNDAVNSAEAGDVRAAIKQVEELKQLGPSYSSKHLRMLLPRVCVAYDTVLDERFGKRYRLGNRGNYAEFCHDCAELAKTLRARKIPKRDGGEWRAADVEAAMFGKFCHRTECESDCGKCGKR